MDKLEKYIVKKKDKIGDLEVTGEFIHLTNVKMLIKQAKEEGAKAKEQEIFAKIRKDIKSREDFLKQNITTLSPEIRERILFGINSLKEHSGVDVKNET